ncbi:MAG: Gfo/Idh/MocA family oxidoreductase, partial [Anaerolineae bacterium]
AADAGRIVAAEAAVGRQLVAVGFMRRYDPQHVAVKQAIESGIMGRPVLFRGVHRNADVPPHFAADLIINGSAVHDIDSARWLLGQEIETVYARGIRTAMSLPEDVCDLVLLQLSLSGNTLATIEVYVTAGYGYEVQAEVVGERGTAVTMQPDHIALRVKSRRSHPVPADWLTRFQDAYVAELNQWALALCGQPFRGASAWDGYLSLLAADASLKSLRSGEPEPVSCPAVPDLYCQ